MNIIGNKTTRQSGIELLRLIAMLMVLLLHANFLSFGAPTAEQIHTDTANSIGRIFLEHPQIRNRPHKMTQRSKR